MTPGRDGLRVDGERLRRSLEAMAAIGATPGGGLHRLRLSDERRARDFLVPSIAGRSHVEAEETSWEDCEAGANVLLHCVPASPEEPDAG